MCAALRSEEGGGSRMRVRPERCTSLPRSARTLTPTPLPEGEGITTRSQSGTLLPPGEGGGSRMRVRAERCTSRLRSARTLTPPPLPEGEGITSPFQMVTLLPPGEGGGSRMRVRAERCASLLRSARTLIPTPLSHRDYLRVAGGEGLLSQASGRPCSINHNPANSFGSIEYPCAARANSHAPASRRGTSYTTMFSLSSPPPGPTF